MYKNSLLPRKLQPQSIVQNRRRLTESFPCKNHIKYLCMLLHFLQRLFCYSMSFLATEESSKELLQGALWKGIVVLTIQIDKIKTGPQECNSFFFSPQNLRQLLLDGVCIGTFCYINSAGFGASERRVLFGFCFSVELLKKKTQHSHKHRLEDRRKRSSSLFPTDSSTPCAAAQCLQRGMNSTSRGGTSPSSHTHASEISPRRGKASTRVKQKSTFHA